MRYRYSDSVSIFATLAIMPADYRRLLSILLVANVPVAFLR